jgi:hypothetical protein
LVLRMSHAEPADMRIFRKRHKQDEQGQSLTELAIGLPFVLLIIIGIVEMGMVFATYISMINATREGAVFASMHPELSDVAGGSDSDILAPGTTTIYDEYESRVLNEVFVVTTQQLRANQLLTEDTYDLKRPFTDGTTTAGTPITVTLVFSISTFSSNISLPYFGRFGLPNRYRLQYSFAMPIR